MQQLTAQRMHEQVLERSTSKVSFF